MNAVQSESIEAYVQDACVRLANVMRDEITHELTHRLRGWVPPPEALAQFPFLGNISDFIFRYSECLIVRIDRLFIPPDLRNELQPK